MATFVNSGPNQHYIPRFVQRAFGIPPQRKWIWYFERDKLPEQRAIKRTASEEHFYSHPAYNRHATLDNEISGVESRLSSILRTIRSVAIGRRVDPSAAAPIVAHLASRTAHLRNVLKDGVDRILDHTSALFANPDNLQRLAGLDRPAPNDQFRKQIFADLMNRPEIAGLNVPTDVLERVAFYLAKETVSDFATDNPLVQTILKPLVSGSGAFVRTSHNKALVKNLKANPRDSFLRRLDWTIESAPAAGAILPDCVVIAIDQNGKAGPFMLTGADGVHAVIMPVSPKKLLLGRRDEYRIPETFKYNVAAAGASYSFFLSTFNDAETARLHPLIGDRSTSILNEGVEYAFRELLPERSPQASPNGVDRLDPAYSPIRPTATGFQYELSLVGFENREATRQISTAIKDIVSILSGALPLARLDGFTITGDYPAALRDLDRGLESAPSPTTVAQEVGVGVAQVVTVLRSGHAKGRIVMSSEIAHALISDNAAQIRFAIHILVKELGLVAMLEIIESALPGVLLSPIEDELDGWLYANVDAALSGYVASFIAAGFGDQQEVANAKRQLLADSINRMKSVVPRERLAYRDHGNLDQLLAVALPAVRQVLIFAADLLGHSSAAGLPPFNAPDDLECSLEQAGLKNWLSMYKDDLERFHRQLGRWASFQDFLFFTLHVERLFWQFGMFPWEGPGGIRVEIPLNSDAAALLSRQQE